MSPCPTTVPYFLLLVALTAVSTSSQQPQQPLSSAEQQKQQQQQQNFRHKEVQQNLQKTAAEAEAVKSSAMKASLKMLGPQKLEARQRSGGVLPLPETDYFKPKEYTSRDFPRLVDGLGQQIRQDLEKAHSALAAHAQQVRLLEMRMKRLEREFRMPDSAGSPQSFGEKEGEEAVFAGQPMNKFLFMLCLSLLLALAMLLCANFLLLKRSQGRNSCVKHVRLADQPI